MYWCLRLHEYFLYTNKLHCKIIFPFSVHDPEPKDIIPRKQHILKYSDLEHLYLCLCFPECINYLL